MNLSRLEQSWLIKTIDRSILKLPVNGDNGKINSLAYI